MTKPTMLFALALASLLACKKEVKPDESTASTATAAVSVPPPPVEVPDSGAPADMDASVAPLASLEAPKKVVAPPTKPKVDPPECISARSTCANPSVGTNARVKALCDGQKAACIKAGGKV